MNYLKTIPYIIIIALLGGIVYLQFNFHRDITNINNQLVESQKQFAEYQLKQKEMQVNIITEITEANNQRMSELNEAINKINTVTNNNRTIINELRAETKAAEANYDSLSEASRKYYTQALSNVFNESAELLVEFAEAADRSTEAAVMYHGMLVDQYEIVNKYNQDLEKK